MSNVRVRLWEHVGTGIILRWPSGIIYEQQMGGLSCSTGELEGVFVPVGNDLSPDGHLLSVEIALREHFAAPPHFKQGAVHGLSEADATAIEVALHKNLLLSNVTVDRSRLNESFESWVQVLIEAPDPPFSIFTGFGPFPLSGVLTWTGS